MLECVIFGGLLLDKYYEIKELPERGQDGFITDEFECVGGCSINMAATFNNLGGNAHIVSYVGNDATGLGIMGYMKQHDFSTRYVIQKPGKTGYSMVFLEPDGERTFLTKAGLELDFTREIVADQLKGLKYAAVTGYFLLNNVASTITEVLEEFSEAGGTILFDPSPLVDNIDPNVLKRILTISDVVTPNHSEIGALISCTMPETETCKDELIKKWTNEFVRKEKTVVLKNGARGGSVNDKGVMINYNALQVDTVDTTGAGDSFAAGLLYGIADGLNMEEAIALALRCAAITVGINRPHGFWKMEEK